MYRINSTTSQVVTFQVVNEDKKKLSVTLLPKNFVFTEELTDQIKNLEANKVIKVREVSKKPLQANAKPVTVPTSSAPEKVETKESTGKNSKK